MRLTWTNYDKRANQTWTGSYSCRLYPIIPVSFKNTVASRYRYCSRPILKYFFMWSEIYYQKHQFMFYFLTLYILWQNIQKTKYHWIKMLNEYLWNVNIAMFMPCKTVYRYYSATQMNQTFFACSVTRLIRNIMGHTVKTFVSLHHYYLEKKVTCYWKNYILSTTENMS